MVTALSFGLAAAVVVAVAGSYGFSAFAHAWRHLHWGWLLLAGLASLAALPGYGLAYRTLAQVKDEQLAWPLVARVLMAGFGPSAVGGGFALDKLALHALGGDEDKAAVRVLGLGALEWAVLAPAAWICAVVLLVTGDHRPMTSLLWPWAIAVPVGFALGLPLAGPRRRERITRGGSFRRALDKPLRSVGVLLEIMRTPWTCWSAWAGAGLYWTFEIASLYSALRFIGLHLDLGEVVLAYATGYALTRRSLPLGGAGVTEALMTFALHWVGQPVVPSLAAVVVYRVFNLVLPTLPAMVVRPEVKPLLDAAQADRPLAARDRKRAAAPLGPLG